LSALGLVKIKQQQKVVDAHEKKLQHSSENCANVDARCPQYSGGDETGPKADNSNEDRPEVLESEIYFIQEPVIYMHIRHSTTENT